LVAVLFAVGAIWAFANPINAFWALASVLGLLLILPGRARCHQLARSQGV